jgi:hypothetical protein
MKQMTTKQTIVFILVIVVALYVGQYIENQIIYGQENNKNSTIKPKPECFSLGNIFDEYYGYTRCLLT